MSTGRREVHGEGGGRGAPESRDGRREEVAETLREWFATPDRPVDEGAYLEVALRIFQLQFDGNQAYRRFCRARGRTPGQVERWEDVPLVPATAFKYLDLYSGTGEPEVVFVTSGTTAGSERRGRHPVASASLYREAAVPWFQRHLVPEGGRLTVLCLVPGPDRAPHSSLSAMMDFVVDALGTEESGFFAHPDRGVEVEPFRGALEGAATAGVPVLVMGTAFAWVHWLEWAASEGWRVPLPPGSRLMETGGFKGRSRTVSRDLLYRDLSGRLGIPETRMVNEYGMTELLSQLYQPVLRTGTEDTRMHVPPPWLRVRALDPETLAPRPPGEAGLLAFFDPANLGSVSAVLTEDVGWVGTDGVHLVGRSPGAEPRGCSLALEQLLEGRW